jgi:hypothetical protein
MTENLVSLRLKFGAANFDNSDVMGATCMGQLP